MTSLGTWPAQGYGCLGMVVYGLSPVLGMGGDLVPAMTFRSQVPLPKHVPAGEGVSYGHVRHTDRKTALALVHAGYAVGMLRALTGWLNVRSAGRRRPAVGRMCLDQVMVGCVDDPVGVDVEIVFGIGESDAPTAAKWADKPGTVHYEVIAGRVRGRRLTLAPNPTMVRVIQ